ncbi:MAG: hypothetical protein RBU25_03215 [Lentisphaeria bacterium]|jgi:hypothetical protein|nr:hypothetical protein [Lentisphaeria bacterium]
MNRCPVVLLALALLSRLCAAEPAEIAYQLGIPAEALGRFVPVHENGLQAEVRRATPVYKPERDVVAVHALHAGEDRNVWRVDFAAPPRPESAVLHLYVDADGDEATGRQAARPMGGTDYMVTLGAGNASSRSFTPDGTAGNGPRVAFAVQGNSLYMVCDFPVRQREGRTDYTLYVLSHDAGQDIPDNQRMTDSIPRFPVNQVPIQPGRKIRRFVDYTATEGFAGTFRIGRIREILFAESTRWRTHDHLELDGYEVDVQTNRQFGSAIRTRPEGSVAVAAPAGTFHVAVLVYDSSRWTEGLVLRVAGENWGAIVGDADNNRFWLHWTETALVFQGGERVEVVGIGANGNDPVSGIAFLPDAPDAVGFDCRIENFAWQVPVGEPGTVRLSWTTSEPTPTTLDHSAGTVETPKSRLHRAVLTGLDPNVAYQARITGTRRDGTPTVLDGLTFSTRPPVPPLTAAEARTVPLRVRNPHGVAAQGWPVTSGIPFPQGMLASETETRLLRDGQPVPAQIRATGHWPDGSVKWLLLTFLADAPAGTDAAYALEYGRNVRNATPPARLAEAVDGVARLRTGAGEYRLAGNGELRLPDGRICDTLVRLAGDAVLAPAGPGKVTVEEDGPVRAVAHASVDLAAPDGRTLGLELRVEAYAGTPFVRVHHTFTIKGKDKFTDIEEMLLRIPGFGDSATVPVVAGEALTVSGRLVQRFDGEIVLDDAPRPARVVGTVLGGGATVALREFWQNYPKSVELADGTLRLGLCPDFAPGLYDEFPFEKEGHHLYFYLLGGVYKFRSGMAKTHELLLGPAGAGDAAVLFQRPLLATAPPEWYCASRAFYDVAPRDPVRFKAYEEAVDANVAGYAEQRERQKDYGLMNFGDWYGERTVNWGNIEYDTQNAFFLEYIRSGNEDAFFLGDQAERHNRDIDTVQWAANPAAVGRVYIHQIGHVGGYYDQPVPGTLGWAEAGSSVSHAWTEGHFSHYFLTGDPRSQTTGQTIADQFNRQSLGGWYDFTDARVPGWHLKINAAAYAATGDPVYLNAARIVAERVLELQDTIPNPLPEYQREPGRDHQIGGWSRLMVPGHCLCTPRHRGNAGFMVSVLLSGLKYYHDVTDDPRVKQAIIDGAHYLVRECYSDEVHGFRYTSCPNMSYRPGTSPLMVEGIARAYRWTRDPELLDPITEALACGAGGNRYGKGFSQYYRMAPRLLADLAACDLGLTERRSAARVFPPFRPPEWIGRDSIVIQAEDFSRQGGGEGKIVADRPAWDKVLTYWHQDPGHWFEWTCEVPANGEYHLRLCYASGSPETRRELKIDGSLPFAGADRLEFPFTGSFGMQPDHWRIRRFLDGEREIAIFLGAGIHTLRMSNLGDGLALDYLVLVPAGTPAPK